MADDRSDTADEEKLETASEQLDASETEVKKVAVNEKTPAADQTPKKSGGSGGVLAILLALIAIGIASYPAWETYQSKVTTSATAQVANPLIAEVEALRVQASNQNRTINSRIAAMSDRLDQLAIDRQGESGEQSALKVYVEQELAEIRARLGSSAQDWVTAEVEYLIRMANQSVLMERDANAARQMLEAADAIIAQTQGFTAHGLRKALAEDIVALRSVATPDTQGIYLELSAMIGQVRLLKQKLPRYEPEATPSMEPSASPGFTEKLLTVASNAGARLASLVDFRRDTVSIQPILPPNEVYYLRQNLVLKIQLAQLALLEGNESAYRQSLTEAAVWIENAFGVEDTAAASLRAALSRLSDERIALDMPDISGSLAEVRRHVAAVHTRVSNSAASVEKSAVAVEPSAEVDDIVVDEALPQ